MPRKYTNKKKSSTYGKKTYSTSKKGKSSTYGKKTKKKYSNNKPFVSLPNSKLIQLTKSTPFMPYRDSTEYSVKNGVIGILNNNIYNVQDSNLQIFNLNGKYTSPPSAGGELVEKYAAQFDEISKYYEKCCIVGQKLTLTYTNTSDHPISIVVGLSDHTIRLVTPSYQGYIGIKYHRRLILQPKGQTGSTKIVKFSYNPNKIANTVKPLTDSSYYISSTESQSSPQNKPYYKIGKGFDLNSYNMYKDYLVMLYNYATDMTTGNETKDYSIGYQLDSSYVFTDRIDNPLIS